MDGKITGYSALENRYPSHTIKLGIDKVPMTPNTYSPLIRFLQEDLSISADSIAVTLRHSEKQQAPLPMVLWQYGLVTLEQLEQIYQWLETA